MTEQLVWVMTTPSCVEFDATRPLAEELAKEVIDSKGGTWVISQSLAVVQAPTRDMLLVVKALEEKKKSESGAAAA